MTEKVKVLLIEDNPAEADLVRAMLDESRFARYVVEHVDRLAAGMERLSRGTVDVVLLDFNLPDASGVAAFHLVRSAAPSLPVVILTSMEDEETALRAVREGAQDYLLKRDVAPGLLSRALRYAIERERADRARRESEERYALAVEGANDGLWDWNFGTGQVYFSPRWKQMLGYESGELADGIGEWFGRIHPDDEPGFQDALSTHLKGDARHFRYEHRIRTRSGEFLWVVSRGVAVRTATDAPVRMAGSLTDISDRKRAEEQMRYDALHDALTGLPNRTLFLDRLGIALERSRAGGRSTFAVICCDLDRFKIINDSFGHAVGDEFLSQISRRLRRVLRPGDTLARLGGDEFAILVDNVDNVVEATCLVDRAHEALRDPFVIDAEKVFPSMSVGVVMNTSRHVRAEDILRDAEIAMYRAKANASQCCEVFDQDMHQTVIALLQMENDLRRALSADEFSLYYQPIVSLDTGRMRGFEALLRWRHPTRGLIAPDQFIAIAEETGFIVPLGWWVLRQACRQTRSWQDIYPMDPPLAVSVNISGRLFAQPDVVERILELLEESGLAPESLRLEITENVIMNHGDGALAKLQGLRAIGVQLHIDDFGTGYSSLSYLQNFRYDSLKIDRSFVRDLGAAGDGSAIVQALVALGGLLKMNVIAEGVETEDQLRHLRSMQCPQAQGFWFSHPLPVPAAEELLVAQPVWQATA